jgi:predicted AAA+ superfamily ATPase
MSGYEVDFHARFIEGHQELIQVCASLDDPDTREREIRALQKAAEEYPQARCALIALDKPVRLDLPEGVAVHSARDWLLAEQS